MKKLYGYIFTFSLIIPMFSPAMAPQQQTQQPIKKWWQIPSWSKKKIAYSIGAIILTALALFGSYKGMVIAARKNLISQLENGTLPAHRPENKSIIDAYRAATTPQAKQTIIDTIMDPLTTGDIAVNAIGYLTGNPRFPF